MDLKISVLTCGFLLYYGENTFFPVKHEQNSLWSRQILSRSKSSVQHPNINVITYSMPAQ